MKPEKPDIGLSGPAAAVTRYPGEDGRLAILVAGFGYTVDMPVFYYLTRHFLSRKTGVLQVDFGYSRDAEFLALSEEEKDRRFDADIAAVVSHAASVPEEELLLAGKSLGSTVCLRLTQSRAVAGRTSRAAWLTPGTYANEIYRSLPDNGIANMVVYGTADRYTTPEQIDRLRPASNVEILAIKDGDHAMETGSVSESISVLGTVVNRLVDFFG